ncbi:MAG: hypothetical protein KatS3mg017_0270 [Fimbriimonadales bacterium]|nr:MAG: hypothetical protein KatS3mg017_0270 [Fimbriimonadales bacterium]
MTPVGSEQGYIVDVATQRSAPRCKSGEQYVRILIGDGEPAPDRLVALGKPKNSEHALPTTTLLMNDGADTSIEARQPTETRPVRLSSAFWVVNLTVRVMAVYREAQDREFRFLSCYMHAKPIASRYAPKRQAQGGSLLFPTP